MYTFLDETTEAIEEYGYTPDDIMFIGSQETGHSCTWEEFKVLADAEYDNGSGKHGAPIDLVIAFSDGSKMWREMNGYWDIYEWLHATPFKMPVKNKPIKRLFGKVQLRNALEQAQNH